MTNLSSLKMTSIEREAFTITLNERNHFVVEHHQSPKIERHTLKGIYRRIKDFRISKTEIANLVLDKYGLEDGRNVLFMMLFGMTPEKYEHWHSYIVNEYKKYPGVRTALHVNITSAEREYNKWNSKDYFGNIPLKVARKMVMAGYTREQIVELNEIVDIRLLKNYHPVRIGLIRAFHGLTWREPDANHEEQMKHVIALMARENVSVLIEIFKSDMFDFNFRAMKRTSPKSYISHINDRFNRNVFLTIRDGYPAICRTDMRIVENYIDEFLRYTDATTIGGVLKRAEENHDILEVVRHKIKHGDRQERVMQPPVKWEDTEQIRFLAINQDYLDESDLMHHCVATNYFNAAKRGLSYIFHIEYDGEQATVELDSKGRVNQARGPYNRDNHACDWGKAQLEAWVEANRQAWEDEVWARS